MSAPPFSMLVYILNCPRAGILDAKFTSFYGILVDSLTPPITMSSSSESETENTADDTAENCTFEDLVIKN